PRQIKSDQAVALQQRGGRLLAKYVTARRISVHKHYRKAPPLYFDGDPAMRSLNIVMNLHCLESPAAPVNRGVMSLMGEDQAATLWAACRGCKRPCSRRMRSAARSPITTHGAIVLPVVIFGMIDASATRSPSMP